MKKEYLDYIYELRSRIIVDIERLEGLQNQDKIQCCNNMADQDENMAELRTRRSQLSSTDDLINMYIKIHSNK